MKPGGQPEQPKGRILLMLVRKFLCNANNTKALTGG